MRILQKVSVCLTFTFASFAIIVLAPGLFSLIVKKAPITITLDNYVQLAALVLFTSFASSWLLGWYRRQSNLKFIGQLFIVHFASGSVGLIVLFMLQDTFLTIFNPLLLIEIPLLITFLILGTILIILRIFSKKATLHYVVASFVIGLPVGFLAFTQIARNDGLAFAISAFLNSYFLFSITASSVYVSRKSN